MATGPGREREGDAERLAKALRREAAVARLCGLALSGMELRALMAAASEAVADALELPLAVVFEVQADGTQLLRHAAHGWLPAPFPNPVPIGPGSQANYVLRSPEPVVVADYATESRFPPAALLVAQHVAASASVRIGSLERPFGLLGAYARTPRAFAEEELRFLLMVAHLLSAAVEQRAAAEALRHQALHDALTGLPNRALLTDRLARAVARVRRGGTSAAVLLLDLDRFKLVNDSLGHDAGDRLLVAASERLQAAVRGDDTVARLGGDEFVVLCEGLEDDEGALDVAERIRAAFTEPFLVGGFEVVAATSVGVAVARPGADADPASLLRDADAALYRAKDRGRGRVEVFDEALRRRAVRRLQLEADLRFAVERGELRLHHQPIVRVADGRVVGTEALLRWDHPELGLLPPGTFIPVAEETGVVVDLGRWVLAEAGRQLRRWAEAGAPPCSIAVNLSPRQLADPGLVDAVRCAVEGLDPRLLLLELTESALSGDDAAVPVLEALRAVGVRCAIDDFGTGWSSLGRLKRLPVEALKIDRSFVDGLGQDPEDGAIVASVVAMARALGLAVVAEGVETEQQLSELRALGCELAQGYLFSPPVPVEELERRGWAPTSRKAGTAPSRTP